VIPRHAAGVEAEPLDDELVLYEPRQAQGFLLNSTAAYIWQQCDGQRDPASIASTLMQAYSIGQRQALADVDACLAMLLQSNLLEVVARQRTA